MSSWNAYFISCINQAQTTESESKLLKKLAQLLAKLHMERCKKLTAFRETSRTLLTVFRKQRKIFQALLLTKNLKLVKHALRVIQKRNAKRLTYVSCLRYSKKMCWYCHEKMWKLRLCRFFFCLVFLFDFLFRLFKFLGIRKRNKNFKYFRIMISFSYFWCHIPYFIDMILFLLNFHITFADLWRFNEAIKYRSAFHLTEL